MDRKRRMASRNNRRALHVNELARTIDNAMYKAGVPVADKDKFVDWAIISLWRTYKEQRMNERMMIENEIRKLAVRLPNGTVKKDYTTTFCLPVNKIRDIELVGARELGLDLEVRDDGTCILSGKSMRAGDFTLRLRYRTVDGEPVSELSIPIAFNPNPRDLWRNIPTDRDIQYYKTDSDAAYIKVEAGAESIQKKDIVAASQRGRSHAQEGKARDDHFSIFHCDKSDWYIIAVADGAGSAKFSRKGSEVACKTVVSHCKDLLLDNPDFEEAIRLFNADPNDRGRRSALTNMVHEIVLKGAKKAHDRINEVANGEEGLKPKDFATTLMFAICKKYDFGWFIASFWVGDGAMCIFDAENKTAKLLGTPDEGEFSGQTRFLTMPEIFRTADVYNRLRMAIVPDFTALFLMTDGVSDPMFETDRNLSDYARWEEFYNCLRTGFPEDGIGGVDLSDDNVSAKDQLLGWLDFWSPGNHDDRTIAILY